MINDPKDQHPDQLSDDQDMIETDNYLDIDSHIVDENLEDDDDFDFDGDLEQDFTEEHDLSQTQQSGRSVNWFNMIMFGVVGIGFIALCIIYLPKFLNDSNNTTIAGNDDPTQFQQAPSAEAKQAIAEAAVGNGLSEKISQSGGILANPDILSDENIEESFAELPTNDNTAIFEDLDNDFVDNSETNTSSNVPSSPSISEEDMMNIFTAAEQEQIATTSSNDFVNNTETQPLPIPSDSMSFKTMPAETINNDISFEPLAAEKSTGSVTQQVNNGDTSNDTNVSDQKDLEAKVEQLSLQVETFVESMQQNNVVSQSDDIQSLQATISRLEQRLNALSSQQASAAKNISPVKEESPTVIDNKNVEKVTPAPKASNNKPVSDNFVVTVPVPASQSTATDTSKPIAQPQLVQKNIPAINNWELRGASRGEAYLADIDGNVRTVKVGDNLNGLGRITSIAVENNQWVVRGTSGVVKQ